MSLKTGAPVIPAAIAGAYEIFPAYRILPRPGKIALVFGEPIRFSSVSPKNLQKQEIKDMNEYLMQTIHNLQEKAYCLLNQNN